MPEPARIIPIPCPFGQGNTIFVYYIDAPQPALIDVGVAGSPEGTIEPALAAAGHQDLGRALDSGDPRPLGPHRRARSRPRTACIPTAQLALHPADNELLADRKSHIRGYQGVRFRFIDDPAGYAAHDAMLLENLSGEMGADRALADGDRIDLGGGVTLTTVHTPGHSAGAVTFILDGTDWAFTGDSIQGRGGGGTFPLIEHPISYRASLKRLTEDVRPTRLLMGHRFGGLDGVPRDEHPGRRGRRHDAPRERRARVTPRGCRPVASGAADRPNDPRQFAPVAQMIGLPTDDPVAWPASVFITMDGYRRAAER